MRPLLPSRGVYDDARSLRANHDETRGEIDSTHDTGLFLEISRHGLHWADDNPRDEPTKLVAIYNDEPTRLTATV